jgi:hypothetical protein
MHMTTANNTTPVMWKYQVSKMRVSVDDFHLFGSTRPGRVELAEQRYRADPDYDGGIHVARDGALLAGLEELTAARKVGITRVRVTLHNDVARSRLAREQRIIKLARTRPDTPPMARIRCLLRGCQISIDGSRAMGISSVAGMPKTTDWSKVIRSILRCTRKEARRYLAIYRCPRAVQDASSACWAGRSPGWPSADQDVRSAATATIAPGSLISDSLCS